MLDKKTGKYKYGFAKHLRDALAQCHLCRLHRHAGGDATTRTPAPCSATTSASTTFRTRWTTARRCRSTTRAAWPSWTSTRPRSKQLNDQVEEIFEDEEDLALREAAKTKWAALEKLVGAEPRIEQVAADLVQHFEARTAAVEGKGMIVAMSREICVAALQRHHGAAAGLAQH